MLVILKHHHRTDRVAQVVEGLLSKCEALYSNFSTEKTKSIHHTEKHFY
jgi:hypothetical protein